MGGGDAKRPLVGIIMGSGSDARIMRAAASTLDELGIPHEDRIVSAHRTPTRLEEYAAHAERDGLRAIIAGAGGAAHLPGMIASFTILPVIGVPIMVYNDKRAAGPAAPGASSFGGLDALLSISEMPSGTPVAAVGVNKAGNAALLAARILASSAPSLRAKLRARKKRMYDMVAAESDEIAEYGIAEFVVRKVGGGATGAALRHGLASGGTRDGGSQDRPFRSP